MHQPMNTVAVCILLVLSVSVSKCKLKSVRARREVSDSVDFDKLSDDDVFALLEKPDDYVFQTEKDIDFDFNKLGEGDDEDVTTQRSTVQSSTSISSTELRPELLPVSADEDQTHSEGSTKILEVSTVKYGSSAFDSEVPSTEQYLADVVSSESAAYSTQTDPSSEKPSPGAFSAENPDYATQTGAVSEKSSTDALPAELDYSTQTDASGLAETDTSSSTYMSIISTDISSTGRVTDEMVSATTVDHGSVSELSMVSTAESSKLDENGDITRSTIHGTTFESIFTKPSPTSLKNASSTEVTLQTIISSSPAKHTTTQETISAIRSTTIHRTTFDSLFTKPSPTSSKNASSTEVTLQTFISSSPAKPTPTQATIRTIQPTVGDQTTLATTPVTTERTTAFTTVRTKTTKRKQTTQKSTKAAKKMTTKKKTTPKKPYGKTTPLKQKYTPKISTIVATKTPTPRLLTSILTTLKPTAAQFKTTTTGLPSKSTKAAVPPYVVSGSNTSVTGSMCFKLFKSDNTLSEECFYPMGMYPVGRQISSPTTTSAPTTQSTTIKSTQKPTTKKDGRMCFMRINSDNKSECFYLNVNPSEAPPRTDTMATFAPHRMFEITEEPSLLPVETVSLLKPPVLNKKNPIGSGSDSGSTFAPDRIFEIPMTGVDQKTKSRKQYNSAPYDSTNVDPISAPRKFSFTEDDIRNNLGNMNGQGRVDLRRVVPELSGRPEWNNQGPVRNPTGQAAGRNVVRFQPRNPDNSHPQNERPGDYRIIHGVVESEGAYNHRSYPGAGQSIDDQRRLSSSGNRSVLALHWVRPGQPRVDPRFVSRSRYPPTLEERRSEKQTPAGFGHVVLIPANSRNQYPSESGPNGPPLVLVPVNSGYNREAMVSNVRVNTRLPQTGNNYADKRRTQYPSAHSSVSAPGRPLLLVPVDSGNNRDVQVSNVRVNNVYIPQKVNNPSYANNHRGQQGFLIPVDRRTIAEQGVSNIRIQIPQQGTFSQQAYVSSSDPQRAAFEHLYLDVHQGRPVERDHSPRQKRAPPRGRPIEETEAISLAFVVDTTLSMKTELNEVKSYVSIIMTEVLNNRGSHIGNFIFVPIHDEEPIHERYLVTRDRSEMTRTIERISVWAGGDCPENSLIGLLKAIELAEKDSHIFVFTDALAKDYHLVPNIIRMIQRKKPRVYFLLTGECKNALEDAQRHAFDDIAAASTGIVARLEVNKTQSTTKLQRELHAVLEAVAREFEKNRRIVTEHEGPATGLDPRDFKISVDPGLTNLSLTSTGHNTKIDVMGPRGRPRDIVKVLDMPNIQIISVPKPDPGEWTVSVISPESPFKIVASGISTTDFLYGFSVTPTNDTSHLSKHPMQGVENHLLLVAKDPSVLLNISNVQLVVGNEVDVTLPISVVNRERGIYSGGPIIFPDETFKIRINAFTIEGYPLTRLSKATIIPQNPGPPYIDCKEHMIATAGFPFNMTCSVESLIKMDVQMYKEDEPYAQTLTYGQTSTVILYFDKLQKRDEGTYIIKARNKAGNAVQKIDLEVHATPPTVYLEQELVGYSGRRLVINCDVVSYLNYTVRWMKKNAPSDNFYRTGAFSLREDDALRIDRDMVILDPVRPEDKGWYICMASNEGGEKSAHSYLTVQEEPSVLVEHYSEYFRRDERISLVCRAEKGVPDVSLSWHDNYGRAIKSGSDFPTNKRVSRRDGSLQLFINGANRNDAGTYTCLGENSAGRDNETAVLQYAEVPKVEAREHRVQALRGERVTLECSGVGVPAPNITWSRTAAGSPYRIPVKSNRKDSPGKYLEIDAVDERDSGMYTCTATNPGGTDEDSIEVLIEHKGHIYRPSELFCGASGVPDPVITWFRVHHDGTSDPIRENTVDGVLRIDNTQLEDGGPYVCLAQNPFGRAESSTVLVVLGAVRPQILKTAEPEVVKSVASRTVNLTCPVTESVPPATIGWYFEEQPVQDFAGMIVSKEDGTLTITNFHPDFSGNYKCVAENPAGNDTKTILLKLFDVPKIEVLPATKSVAEGERFIMVCQASGDPEPEITWHKQDGRLLSETRELVLEQVHVSDAGKYICRAKNVAGIHQTDFNLIVLTRPKIREWEEYIYARNGEIVRLHCDASGNPQPKVTWLKNNETIRRISIEYYRFQATVQSAGTYSCIAHNDVGESRVDTKVIVLVTPLIQDIAEVTEVVAGEAAELKCSAVGNPYPSLSWQFQGETLVKQDVGNDSAVLHIQHVSESDAGTYFCLANSSVGNDQRNTTLKVLQPPKVKCSDVIYRVVPREKTKIHCDVLAIPSASVVWYKDGHKFGYVREDGTLEFVAQPEDSGPLRMVAENKAGSVEHIVNLVVLKPPAFSSISSSINALVGTNVTLQCDAQGDPKPDITWEQYNYPVLPNKLDFNPSSGELHILKVELADDGAYTCTAKNRVGYSSHTVFLSVLSRPTAVIKSWDLKDGVIKEGRELTLICGVSGSPTPDITWTKDGFPVSESNSIRSPNKLKFVTTPESTGLYSCTAQNEVGQDTSSIYVNVTTKPSIDHSEDQFITELEGRSMELECVAHGNPPPSVTWQRNGAALKVFPDYRVDTGRLVISNLSTSMEGSFICKASNYLGAEEKLFRLTVNSFPVIRTDVPERIYLNQFDDYAIPCVADGKPTPQIYWKIRGEHINPGSWSDGEKFVVRNDGTLVMKNVTIDDVGKYVCFAENVEGKSTKSHDITVIVPSDASPSAEVATVQESASKRLVCPYENGVWLKNGKPVDTRNQRGDDPHYSLKEGGKVLLISGAEDSDFAVFSCETPDGLRQDFNVKVLSRPSFYEMPIGDEDHWISDGKSIVVNCSAKGYPNPRVAWHKDDPTFGWIPFTNYTLDGVDFSGAQNGILSISKVRLRHNGTYRCVVRNDQGKDARVFSIKWTGPPQLKGEPQVIKRVAVGAQLDLNCDMQGTSEPSYSWKFRRSGEPKFTEVLQDDKTLVIDRVTSKHNGQYTCEASNDAGSAVQTFDVHVIEAPELMRTSVTSLTYKTLEDIELNCTSRGPEDEVNWMKDGIFLIKSDRVALKSFKNPNGTTTHNLRMVNVSRDDSGTYKCVVGNMAGEAQQLFNVNVIVPPQVIPASSNVEVELGRPLTFNCSVASESDREVVWRKDGRPPESDKIIGDEVVIDATTMDDGGVYTCDVTHSGVTISVTKYVTILVPPRILDVDRPPGPDLALKAGDKFELSCVAEGDPTPTLSWSKNGKNLNNGTPDNFWVSIDGSKLVKENVTEDDNGGYSCYAVSRVSPPAERYYNVIVYAVPEDHFPNGTYSNYTVQLNHSLDLTCPLTVFSNQISWYKDNQMLDENYITRFRIDDDFSRLKITRGSPEDGGVYSCRTEGHHPVNVYIFSVIVTVPYQWSNWTEWTTCSHTCGFGEQSRTRTCVPPPTLPALFPLQFVRLVNDSCSGLSKERRRCENTPCPIDGGLSEWSEWEICSASCGKGVQRRNRRCDRPLPSEGGRPCTDPLLEERECSSEPCPVHGGWSEWSEWSECSASCGYSVRYRDRQCNNPAPSHGGMYCEGTDRRQEEACQKPSCPGEGIWGEWSAWSKCSRPCGAQGFKRRTRICLNEKCSGYDANTERKRCVIGQDVPPCRKKLLTRRPRSAELLVNGLLNEQLIVDSKISIDAQRNGSIAFNSTNPLKMKDAWFPYINFLVPSVTWSFAEEEGDSTNGYSLSHGKFKHIAHYSFSTGEVLKVESTGKGLDFRRNRLIISVNVLGSTPVAMLNEAITIRPYDENLVQRGEDLLNSDSSGEISLNGSPIEYNWNITIELSEHSKKGITYPVENVKTDNIAVHYDDATDSIWYSSSSTISYKLRDKDCPEGFTLDPAKDHCEDFDECMRGHKCLFTQLCKNTVGSFECTCPDGLTWNSNINMCQGDIVSDRVEPAQLIASAITLSCAPGFERDGMHCRDIDECDSMQNPCPPGELCTNTEGSYRCIASPCYHTAAERLKDGTCLTWCNGSFACESGASVAEISKTIYVQLQVAEAYGEIAKLVMPVKSADSYTIFNINSSNKDLEFRIRHEVDCDVLYSLADAMMPDSLNIRINAIVYDAEGEIESTGEFTVHIVNNRKRFKRKRRNRS